MKNFDSERRPVVAREEREFKIGGEVFVRRSRVRPDVLTGWDDVTDDTPAAEVLKIADELILSLIEDEAASHDRWLSLRTRDDDDALELPDIISVIQWLIQEATGRPTGQPPASAGGSVTPATTTTSTADSASSAAAA